MYVWVHKDLVEQVNSEEEENSSEVAKRQYIRLRCLANAKAKQKLQLYNTLCLWFSLLHFALAFGFDLYLFKQESGGRASVLKRPKNRSRKSMINGSIFYERIK